MTLRGHMCTVNGLLEVRGTSRLRDVKNFACIALALAACHGSNQDTTPKDKSLDTSIPSVDPTLWSVGQITGLRRAMQMIAHRAGEANYQSIKKFSHFEDKSCYQCHHKLLEDGVRQAPRKRSKHAGRLDGKRLN